MTSARDWTYWHKGCRDPDAGKPNRHAIDKVALLAQDLDRDDLVAALQKLAEKRPEAVLDALIELYREDCR